MAFLTGDGANVLDVAGPWEVFQDVVVPGRESRDESSPFDLFTVADGAGPIRMSGGLRVIPDFTTENAPQPRVIVVPSMCGTERTLEWLRWSAARADVTLSVCRGAYQLASAGLLDGLSATTHREWSEDLAQKHSKVRVEPGRRFVEGSPRVATAAGSTSGIDLALRVVERYFGRAVAQNAAQYLEHAD